MKAPRERTTAVPPRPRSGQERYERVAREFHQRTGRGLRGARILLIGIAYKKNVADIRERPAFKLIELLEQRGATVEFYDPQVSQIPMMRKHPELAGRTGVRWSPQIIAEFDIAVIATDHASVGYSALCQAAKLSSTPATPALALGSSVRTS